MVSVLDVEEVLAECRAAAKAHAEARKKAFEAWKAYEAASEAVTATGNRLGNAKDKLDQLVFPDDAA